MQMAIVADDLTGALDAGVCMLPSRVAVATSADRAADTISRQLPDVLSVNAGTRHLSPSEAYDQVAALVRLARHSGCQTVFKKTDSALRGNVGAELAAALEVSGAPRLHFLPAFPAMGRTTLDGVHLVDGVPVAQSAFGSDPFEPVRQSYVVAIIATQTSVPVRLVRSDEPVPQDFEGIVVYDAQTDDAMYQRVVQLRDLGELGAVAGCAGLAQALRTLHYDGRGAAQADFGGNLLAVCGSVNIVSRAQCRYAQDNGAAIFPIAERQKCDAGWIGSDEGRRFVREVSGSWRSRPLTVVDGSGMEDLTQLLPKGADVRQTVADNVARLLLAICREGIHGSVLVMGGDILSSFLTAANVGTVRPLGEATHGIVVFQIEVGGCPFSFAAKSGGFGAKDLFVQLANGAISKEGVAQ